MILGILTAILIILILLISGDKGSRSIVTTVLNAGLLLAAIFLINRGASPVPVTIGCCVLITGITLYYQNEGGVKSRASFLSVLTVILIMIPLVYWFALHANASGIPGEQYEITDSNGYTRNIGISMLSLQISIMFIALIGTVIDTAVAITAAIYEIRANNKDLPLRALIESSFTVSKAVLSTSIHTIFYIYIAEYMTLFIQYLTDYSFATVLNSLSLSRELITISISGIGCCLVVPVATVLGAIMVTRDRRGDSAEA
ncbi:YibE/F family protein [Hornefia butyriciproducens]|uniref:YibE/F family protein n=1 Tax=Hornefia butyriciproducens TaxID=2652293 RepID=UPI0029FD6C6A|nr:YibE/F family protein [Hornefia butyriciproducens]MDD7019159.1 YibE/F family protein [Hornefia butyriciproducens]MDY5423242.1 YibE/F family protein [Hornefia butyriciproducens]MDY5463272.1 YibE/F family protein [Hornefia butyriciproducens]